MCVRSCFSRVRLFVTLCTVAARLLCRWDSPGKNTGVGCHFLLQGIFCTQGSNLYCWHLTALTCGFFTTSATWEAPFVSIYHSPVLSESLQKQKVKIKLLKLFTVFTCGIHLFKVLLCARCYA